MSQPFLFDQEFDEKGRTRPKVRQETYGEDDLTAARAQAYAEGEIAGSQAAQSTIEAQAADALQVLAAQVGQAAAEFESFSSAWKQHAAGIAVAIGRTLAGRLLDAHPHDQIEAMILRCVGEMHEEPRLVIRTSQAVAEAIRDRLGTVAQSAGFDGHLVLLPEDTMSDQDCRVEWAEGGVERDFSATEDEIRRAVDAFLAA